MLAVELLLERQEGKKMATQIEVVDAAMQLLSHIADGMRKRDPNKFALAPVHSRMQEEIYAECEKAAYEQCAWYELVRALGDPEAVRNALEDDDDAAYPVSMSLYVEPDRRCIRRVSSRLTSDAWLARVYGDMAALLLAALEMHGNLRNIGLAIHPRSGTLTIRTLPVVFPRIEVTDDSAQLCLTIELGHIASDGAYVEWARGLGLRNTKVMILQPRRFKRGLFAYIRRKLEKSGAPARVLRANAPRTAPEWRAEERMQIGLDDAEREAHVVSRFWNPTEYRSSRDDAGGFESESIWGDFSDLDSDLSDPETAGWCDLVQPQVTFLRAGAEQGMLRLDLPWPRCIRSARANVLRALERADRGAF